MKKIFYFCDDLLTSFYGANKRIYNKQYELWRSISYCYIIDVQYTGLLIYQIKDTKALKDTQIPKMARYNKVIWFL